MTPGIYGAVLGALAGLGLGIAGARAIAAGIDRQTERASEADAAKFAMVRRLAGPIVIASTIVEVAVVGYVAAELLAG